MEQIWSLLEDNVVVQSFAEAIRAWSPPDHLKHEKHWYLTAEQHAVDTLIFLPPLLASLAYGIWLENREKKHSYWQPVRAYQRSFADVCLGLLCSAWLATSAYGKVQREGVARGLSLMLAPCHIVTVLFAGAMLFGSSQRERAAQWFNMALFFSFFTLLALAVPDLEGLGLINIVCFWGQHWTLVLLPIYLIALDRFPIHAHYSHAYFFQAAGFMGGVCCFTVHQIASLGVSINVNYLLFPPPGQPIQGRFYLYGLAAAIIVTGYIAGQIVPVYLRQLLVRKPHYNYSKHSAASAKKVD